MRLGMVDEPELTDVEEAGSWEPPGCRGPAHAWRRHRAGTGPVDLLAEVAIDSQNPVPARPGWQGF